MTGASLPIPRDDAALFLDIDGTLIDIAPTPQTVELPAGLPALLGRLSRRFAGSLALVSGRSLDDIDQLFRPFRFPAAGVHGAERRDALGDRHYAGLSSEDLAPARIELRRFAARHPALLFEDKGRSLALHFRQAPQLESAVREALELARIRLAPEAHLQPGHCVIELKGGSATKRAAIEEFMQEPPFAGRVPVYLGDDLTDMDALNHVQSAGGLGIYVGPQPQPGLGWLPRPAAVLEWLRSLDTK
ncbi:MAG TPA: trehalose-phosphatase [Steroidobacteraceae bacterium]|nr:trehalose-phosphatase [Steroidobacteraceae bacterium]